MEDIRKERLMLVITTLAAIACILQNHFGGWEFWVPSLIVVVTVVLWAIHILQDINMHVRCRLYFAFSAFLCFYHGIRDTSLFEVSVAFMLFMATYSVLDSMAMLNIMLLEYAAIMTFQLAFLQRSTGLVFDGFNIMKIVFQILSVQIT